MRASRTEIGNRTSLALVGERCQAPRKLKTPPASEDTDGVFHAFTSFKVAALEGSTDECRVRSTLPIFNGQFPHPAGSRATFEK